MNEQRVLTPALLSLTELCFPDEELMDGQQLHEMLDSLMRKHTRRFAALVFLLIGLLVMYAGGAVAYVGGHIFGGIVAVVGFVLFVVGALEGLATR